MTNMKPINLAEEQDVTETAAISKGKQPHWKLAGLDTLTARHCIIKAD